MATNPTIYKSPYDFTQLAGTTDRSRVGGSGFTVFTWQGKPITFARQIQHQSAAPVGPGTTPIHPLDAPYPVELITPMALTMGQVTLELYELFGQNVWQRLVGLNGPDGGPVDLAGIFQAVANTPSPIHIVRIIRPPKMRQNRTMKPYTMEFHNCVVSSIDDGETIEIGTMEVLKRLTVNYTHITRGGKNGILNEQPGTTFDGGTWTGSPITGPSFS